MPAAPVVIDLSSDSVDEPAQIAAPRAPAPDFSDPFEDFEITTARATKRRRLNDESRSKMDSATCGLIATKPSTASYRDAFSKQSVQIDDDEIIVSSSIELGPGLAAAAQSVRTQDETLEQIREELAADVTERAASKQFSSNTAALLVELSGNAGPTVRRADPKGRPVRNYDASLSPESKVRKRIEAQQIKVAKRQEIQLAKEAEAARKQADRERKAEEKQKATSFAKANQARQWDKKNSASRVVVDFSPALADSASGAKITAKLRELQIEHAVKSRELSNIVTWRRKVNTTFNEDLNHWELAEEKVVDEEHVLCHFEGEEMCRILFNGSGPEELDDLVGKVKRQFSNYQVLLLLEGVDAALRKFRSKSNKAYRSAVRQGNPASTAIDTAPQDHAAMVESVEEALMHLQIVHGCGVLQTSDGRETAEWIAAFSEQIATAPSRVEKDSLEADFCMEIGQMRAGEDSKDTFIKMLQQVTRLTAPIAYGITAEYADVPSLAQAFETGGPLILQDIKKCANRDGALTDARIGPQISRRLAQIFLETDPDITEI